MSAKENYTLTLTNKKIWKFYNENPHISFEEMNIIFHEFVEKFANDISSSLRTTINTEILNSVKDQSSQLGNLKLHFENLTKTITNITESNINSQILQNVNQQGSQITEIKTNISHLNQSISKLNTDVTKLNTDITNNLIIKFIDIKKEYVEDMKNIITLSSTEKNDKLFNLIEKNNDHLIDKTTLLLNEVIPKTNEPFQKTIQENLKKFYSTLREDTDHLLESVNNDSLKEFLNTFELKSSLMLQQVLQPIFTSIQSTEERLNNNIANIKEMVSTFENKVQQPIFTSIQSTEERLNNNISNIKDMVSKFENKVATIVQGSHQPLLSYINASEERLNTNITSVKDSSTSTSKSQEKLFSDLSEFLNKYRNSSLKGQLEQNHLQSVLTDMFPTAEIVNTSNISAMGDFILKRKDLEPILIENKDYDTNVTPKEIEKFIRDVNDNNYHGIFLSQKTGITSKSNYQIELHNGNILVYVHCVHYEPEKIRIAIDIIDNLRPKLDELDTDDDDNYINKDTLDDINREYQLFATQKNAIITFVKDNQKKLITQLEDLKFSTLNSYLSSKYSFVQKDGFTCSFCKKYHATNRKSLSAHERACKKIANTINVNA